MKSPLHLTPLSPGWGWRLRLLEITVQVLGLFFVQPLVWLSRGLDRLLSRVLP